VNRRNLVACIAFWILFFVSSGSIAAELKITVTDPTTGKTISEYEKSYTSGERAQLGGGNEQTAKNEQKGEGAELAMANNLASLVEQFNRHFNTSPGGSGRLSKGDLQAVANMILILSRQLKGERAKRITADLLTSLQERVNAHFRAAPTTQGKGVLPGPGRLSPTELGIVTAMIPSLSGAPVPPKVPDPPQKTVNVTPNPVPPKVPEAPRGAINVMTGQYSPLPQEE